MDGELDGLVKQLSEALYRRGEDELANQWKVLTLDARYDDNGGFWVKIRAGTSSENGVSVDSDNTIDLLLISINSCRDTFGSRWYGLLMTVNSTMDCTVDFNYDPKCEQDTAFFEQ